MFGEAAMAECVLKLQHACVNRTSRSSPVHGVMCMVKRGGFARLLGKQVDYSGSLLWVLRFHYVNVVWTDTAHLLLALGSGLVSSQNGFSATNRSEYFQGSGFNYTNNSRIATVQVHPR